MKVRRSFFTQAFLSLMFVGLLVLNNPVSGYAQNPHACVNGTAHLGNNLGNKPSYTFEFYKTCNGYWSYATTWQFIIKNAAVLGEPIICTSGAFLTPVPPTGMTSLSCPVLPTGTTARIKIIINYTVPPNNPMVHSHTIFNY